MGWGYALLWYHPEVKARSFSAHLKVKLVKPKEILFLHFLKGLAQAKIIKKSVILFRVLNMTIWCKHVHRLELQIFIIFVLRIHQLG